MDLPILLFAGLMTSGYILKKRKHKPVKSDDKSGVESKSVYSLNQRDSDILNEQSGGQNNAYHLWSEGSNLNRLQNPDYDQDAKPPELEETNLISNTGLDNVNGALTLDDDNGWAPLPYNLNDELNSVPRAHNNMVPFFGGTSKQNMNSANILNSLKLETFTGDKLLKQTRKSEIEPLFAPAPQARDQIIPLRENDRTVPSNLGRRNNELPFAQETVGPGLNDGFTSVPSGGFHPRLRILPKDNDALNVNPRVTHEGRVITGKGPVTARTSEALAFKYRPETLVTNFDGERNFVTTGIAIAPTSRSKVDLKPTARQQFSEHYGVGGSVKYNTPESLLPSHKASTRQNFLNTPYRNVSSIDHKRPHIDHTCNYVNRSTERAVSGPKSLKMISNLKTLVTRAYNAYFDKAKETKAESTINHPRSEGGNLKAGHAIQTYHTDEAKTTGRETIGENSHSGHIGKSREAGPIPPSQMAKTTLREILENHNYYGGAGGETRTKIVNTNDTAKTTGRETIGESDYLGAHSNGRLASANGFTDTAKTTIRETLEDSDHRGAVSHGRSGVAIPFVDSAKTTVRETTDTGDYQGAVGQGRYGGNTPFVDAAKTTVRETTDGGDYQGAVGQGRRGGNTQFVDTAKTTVRETTDSGDYQGAVGKGRLGVNTQFVDTAKTTVRETTDSGDYQGAVGKGRLGVNTQFVDTAKTTVRETTDGGDYQGAIGRGRNGINTQFVDAAKTTVRETTESGDYQGAVGRGRNGINTQFVDTAKTTVRETTESGDYQGAVGRGRNGVNTPFIDEARTTVRETTTSGDYQGAVGKGRRGGNTQFVDEARTTIRETTDGGDYIYPADNPNKSGGAGYLVTEVSDRPTQRQTTTTSYTGSMAPKGFPESHRLYDDFYNARTNSNREKIIKARDTLNGNISLNSGPASTNVQVRRSNRENNYSASRNPVFANSRLESTINLTSYKNNPPSESSRLDASLVESLQDNPLSRNLRLGLA